MDKTNTTVTWQRKFGNLPAKKWRKDTACRSPYASDELVVKESCERGREHERSWEEIEHKQGHKGLGVQGMDLEEFTGETHTTRIRGAPSFRGKVSGSATQPDS